jgi:PAS domain S-box-containing protein
MKNPETHDMSWWQRLLLVGIVGALPLFIVSLVLIQSSHTGSINFTLQEQRGIAFQRSLEQLLDLLPCYQAGGVPGRSDPAAIQRQIDQAMAVLAADYHGELGRALKFSDAELAIRKRDNARLDYLQNSWLKLKAGSLSPAARDELAATMVGSLRSMINHAGDMSNLILDDELDSYYLMDITLRKLPSIQQQQADIARQVGGWLRAGQVAGNKIPIAVMSVILRQEALDYAAQRDVQVSLYEDRNFNGLSPSLQTNLPPAAEKFRAANESLLSLLDRVADGRPVAPAEFEATAWNAHAESLRFWQTCADELNRLLDARLQAIRSRREQYDLMVIFTLGLVAVAMGLLIRGLLAARYAEGLKMAEVLRTKEAQVRAIGDNLPNGMVYQIMRDFDGTMRFLHVSAGIERLNGLSAAAVLGDATLFTGQVVEEDRARLIAARQTSLASKSVFHVVVRMRRADGALRWMQLSSTPHRLPDGRFVWDGIETDVTENSEAALRIEHLNRVHAVLSGINHTIVREKDPLAMFAAACRIAVEKGRFRMAWIGMLEPDGARIKPAASAGMVDGYLDLLDIDLRNRPEACGPAVRAMLTGSHVISNDIERDQIYAPWRNEALRRGYRSSGVFPIKAGDRLVGHISLYADEPGFFDKDEILLLNELAMDIGFACETHNLELRRQAAEASFKQSEERFARIFHITPIPISFSRLEDGIMVDVNEGFLRMSGFTRDEVIGRSALDLKVYPDPSQRAEIVEQLQKHGHIHGRTQRFRTKTGHIRDHILWAEVIALNGRKFVLVMAMDITGQKQLEDQLRQAQKLEALGTLAGGIAHDFNNILGAIISFAELCKMDNPDNAELQDNISQVLKASDRAASLVRQILSFSRQQKHERKNLQLAPVIKEALKLLRATLPATVEIQKSIDGALPSVLANPTQIHQVIMNLCTNAAHAMKGGHGRLSLGLDLLHLDDQGPRPHVELAPGDYVRLTISDTGCGMDEATQRRIFEPFFTTKGPGEGTGLGLSVVHGIVKEHDGVIAVESSPGQGTTFTIYFPARASSAIPEAPVAAGIPRGNGERVLFVDDEPALGEVAHKMMTRLGYRPVIFHNPETAWEAFQQEPSAFDVLVSDLTMPVLTGVDLARRVLGIRPALPVIIASGHNDMLTAAGMHELGIRELLSKPIDHAALAHSLARALQPVEKQPAPA